MFGIGMPEMLLILAIALIVIGPKKLPDLAKSLGRALGEFKKATSDLKRSMEVEELSEVKTAFSELNQDINQTLKGETKPTDSLSTEAGEAATPPEEAERKDPENPLNNLKEAFDDLNQDAAPAPEPMPTDTPQADDIADEPLASSREDDSEVADKGSATK